MSALPVTWAQAIEKVLQSSEKEWLTPREILQEIRCNNLRETDVCSALHSVKRVLCVSQKGRTLFTWDQSKNMFALKSRVDGEVEGQVEVNGVVKMLDEGEIIDNLDEEVDTISVDSEEAASPEQTLGNRMSLEIILKEDKIPKENKENTVPLEGTISEPEETLISNEIIETVESKVSEECTKHLKIAKQPLKNAVKPLECYNGPLGYVVTITPSSPNSHCYGKHPKLLPSPVKCAFPVQFLQSPRNRPHQSKSCPVFKPKESIAVIEYDRLLDVDGGTCVAILPNQLEASVNETYEYDPSQSEESDPPHPQVVESKDADNEGVEVNSEACKVMKKAAPAKKVVDKKKMPLIDDSSLASINLKSLLTMQNFAKLSRDSQRKVTSLLPEIDRVDEYTPTSSAFTNTFFTSACRQWQQLLQSGRLSISQRAKNKMEESRNKVVDEWKKQHFEEELSQNFPPQHPRHKLFYPAPLNSLHRRVIGCVKRVWQCSREELLDKFNFSDSVGIGNGVSSPKANGDSPQTTAGSPEIDIKINGHSPHHSDVLLEADCDLCKANKQLNVTFAEENKAISESNDVCLRTPSPKQNIRSLQICNLSSQDGSGLSSGEQIKRSPVELETLLEPSKQVKSPEDISVSPERTFKSPRLVLRLPELALEEAASLPKKNCATANGKTIFEQDNKHTLCRSSDQDIEKVNLSLRLQISKLCEQQLYRQLELFNRSTEQQINRSLEGVSLVASRTNVCDSKCGKQSTEQCKTTSQVKGFPPTSIAMSVDETDCNGGGTMGNPPVVPNHVAAEIRITPPKPLRLFNHPQSKTGIKRSHPPPARNVETDRVRVRADYLTTLPERVLYRDVLTELMRNSLRNSLNHHNFSSPPVRKQPRKDWQSTHSIYHDHGYSVDCVPLCDEAEVESPTYTCISCREEPMLLCGKCSKYVHQYCAVPESLCCVDCSNSDNNSLV